jgi:predicted nucleic acid-binding protein
LIGPNTFTPGPIQRTRSIKLPGIAEILSGRKRIKALLNHYQLLSIDEPIAERAAELRRRFAWKLPDAFQAALALHHHLRLCTRNTKEFNPKKHSFVEVPYEV